MLQVLDRVQVGGDVVADGGVRAASGLDRADALVGQHAGPAEEVGVLGGVDVVGHDRDRDVGGERAAQGRDERGLAGAHRAADADPHRAPVGVGQRGVPVLVYVDLRTQRDAPPRWRGVRRRCRAGERRRRAGRRPGRPRSRTGRRDRVASRREAGEHGLDAVRVEAEQAHRRAGRAGDRAVRRRERRVRRREPGGRATMPSATAWWGSGRRALTTPQIAWPARSRARPWARDARRRAGEAVRASSPSSRSAGSIVDAANAAATSPVVASRPRRNRPATPRR